MLTVNSDCSLKWTFFLFVGFVAIIYDTGEKKQMTSENAKKYFHAIIVNSYVL